MKRSISTIIFVLAAVFVCGSPGAVSAQGGRDFDVTIINATRGQVFSPPVVISHDKEFVLFRTGEAAMPQLAALAEDGKTEDLITYISGLPSVHDYIVATGPVPPGESTTLQINVKGRFRFVSVVGMLVTTNDAFFAVRTVRVPFRGGVRVAANAYDAGSERNSENCDYIPGPPCDNMDKRDTAGAEGYVHSHAGIHGLEDLDPATHDWRNPVAEIHLNRIRD